MVRCHGQINLKTDRENVPIKMLMMDYMKHQNLIKIIYSHKTYPSIDSDDFIDFIAQMLVIIYFMHA